MKRRANIYSLVGLGLVALLLAGCAKLPGGGAEQPEPEKPEVVDERGFDPLALPADRIIIPLEEPTEGSITRRRSLVEAELDEPGERDSLAIEIEMPPLEADTLNSQAYRVQLFTSRVLGEARQAARVAEEIFDQPVYVDYEVPNYKVRVGSFADRDAAIDYQQKARTAGYSNAWVVMVKIAVKEAAPLYDDMTGTFLPPVTAPVDTSNVVTSEEDTLDSED